MKTLSNIFGDYHRLRCSRSLTRLDHRGEFPPIRPGRGTSLCS